MNNELPLETVSQARCIPKGHRVLPGKGISLAILGPHVLVLPGTPQDHTEPRATILN